MLRLLRQFARAIPHIRHYPYIMTQSKRVNYTVIKVCGEELVLSKLRESGNYNPHANFKYNKYQYNSATTHLYIFSANGQSIYIPCVRDGLRIYLLINYIFVPTWAMLLVLREFISDFKIFCIETQRTYNQIKIDFLKVDVLPCSYVANLNDGWKSYHSSLGKKTKFNLKYYTKKFEQEFGHIEAKVYKQGELPYFIFENFVRLVGKRYDSAYWSHLLDESIYKEFNNDIIAIVYNLGGDLVACNIYYRLGSTLVFIGNTFDEKYKAYSLGFFTTHNSIKLLAEMGFQKVVLGVGDFGYKSRLSNAVDKLYVYTW